MGIRRLRDLTRYRTETCQERAREINRLANLLEDAGIELASVVSDLNGVSSTAMLEAMAAGERDPEVLAGMARGAMRRKHDALVEALQGNFTDHHGFMVTVLLRAIHDADARVALLEQEIERQVAPFRRQVQLLATIPGISTTVAHVMIAEIGVDMSRFPTAGHLAAWAGLAPGNRESAGKHKRAPTRHGDVWLKGALGIAALNIGHRKGGYISARYQRLRTRRGEKRAAVAIAHTMLVAAHHMLAHDEPYHDLGADHATRRLSEECRRRRLITQLDALGYDVELHRREAA
ncbi:IS110 family transposase [Streptomyces sp. NPDC006660]|uniref:IS110 family transposase n=1 Tax=Streptomyces sp. NPDC006660 TaxID=3156901 RepID=UPI0033F6F478